MDREEVGGGEEAEHGTRAGGRGQEQEGFPRESRLWLGHWSVIFSENETQSMSTGHLTILKKIKIKGQIRD